MEVVEEEMISLEDLTGVAEKASAADPVDGEKALSLVVNDLPWIEKYRPKSLSELIAHEEIVNIRQSSLLCCHRLTLISSTSSPYSSQPFD